MRAVMCTGWKYSPTPFPPQTAALWTQVYIPYPPGMDQGKGPPGPEADLARDKEPRAPRVRWVWWLGEGGAVLTVWVGMPHLPWDKGAGVQPKEGQSGVV